MPGRETFHVRGWPEDKVALTLDGLAARLGQL
ncbi:hypothetical protein H4W33_008805 [Kibdelosporangium phytohabitans]|nr:hypothetical protein [Kibdelosporangium phytohabitans]